MTVSYFRVAMNNFHTNSTVCVSRCYGLSPIETITPHGLLILWNCFLDFAVEHWFGCHPTEPVLPEILALQKLDWLIVWLVMANRYCHSPARSPHGILATSAGWCQRNDPTLLWVPNSCQLEAPHCRVTDVIISSHGDPWRRLDAIQRPICAHLGELLLWNITIDHFLDFAAKSWFGSHATECGFAGDIEVWLIDWLI